MSYTSSSLNGLIEGDQIRVLTAGGGCDTGVFIRIESDFLIWVRNDGSSAVLAVTSLDGISINKL